MTERKGFFLAPSKFGKPPGTEDEGPAVLAKPKFTGKMYVCVCVCLCRTEDEGRSVLSKPKFTGKECVCVCV